MLKSKLLSITAITILLMMVASCNKTSDLNNDILNSENDLVVEGISEEASNSSELEKNLLLTDEISEDIDSTDDSSNNVKSEEANRIEVEIYGGEKLQIELERFVDDIYGTGQVDNRWTLDEIDTILYTIQGRWTVKEYVGFVVAPIYSSDLFESDNLDESLRKEFLDDYNQKVEAAKKNIPNLTFTVKEFESNDMDSNYIVVNDSYLSPISIILSLDRSSENYPVFVDRTALSMDFVVEYPVIYIKFFMKYNEDGLGVIYKPATLVLSKDNKFYILVDGAFYSVVEND